VQVGSRSRPITELISMADGGGMGPLRSSRRGLRSSSEWRAILTGISTVAYGTGWGWGVSVDVDRASNRVRAIVSIVSIASLASLHRRLAFEGVRNFGWGSGVGSVIAYPFASCAVQWSDTVARNRRQPARPPSRSHGRRIPSAAHRGGSSQARRNAVARRCRSSAACGRAMHQSRRRCSVAPC